MLNIAVLALAFLLAQPFPAIAGVEDPPDPGEDLVMPDPADLREIYNSLNPHVYVLDWDEVRCGSERVDRCEDELGGTIEVVDGAGCFSQIKLVAAGLASKTTKLARFNKRDDLRRLQPDGSLIDVPAQTDKQQLVTLARDGQLVSMRAVLRDEESRPPGVTIGVRGCRCRCIVWEMTDPQVTNAAKGAVGLVPVSDGGGEDIVRLIMNTLGQNHRHAVIFTSPSEIRHNTSYDEIDEDDLESNNKLKPAVLRNAQPGITSESVSSALATERLGYSGLLLKTAPDIISQAGAEAAADVALATEGYYKISDYSGLDGMVLPYAGPGTNDYDTDDLKGTMCSGLVHYAYTDVGFVLTETFYGASIRNDVAEILHDQIKDDIKAGLGFWQAIGNFLTGSANKIANQVTNCFAGLGCDDNTDTWESGVGSANTVSPDNLLPEEFDVTGSGEAPWGNGFIEAGDHVVNPNGAVQTPFSVIEPMNVLGTTWNETEYILW
ncbi:MAG TPA: hypothetical protein VEC57_20315 [Candidatus Limnocylindrales bacterium]|nr:hypothetical protein [Candidatus Limnocylindrales bacterium]